jgi:hypothetical protein
MHSSLRVICALLFQTLKQHGLHSPSEKLSSFKNPGLCCIYLPSFPICSIFLSLNSNIFAPGGTFFASFGIIVPYFPDLTCSSVKLTLSFKLQYRGQIYLYCLFGVEQYLIA